MRKQQTKPGRQSAQMKTQERDDAKKDAAPRDEERDEEAAVSLVEVADFTREFAAFIDEGESLVRTFAALEEKQANPHLKRIIGEVNAALQQGHTLSGALARYPTVFDKSYVDTVRLGEVHGTLDLMLHGLAHGDDILSFEQAVQFLGTSQPTLYRLLKQGDVKGLKVGRQWRFRKADLVAHMERRPSTVGLASMRNVEAELAFFADELRAQGVEPPALEATRAVTANEPAPPDEQKVHQLVRSILLLALHRGASDIHIEPQPGEVRLRLRHDGVLHTTRAMPSALLSPLLDRLKVMAGISAEEKRLPQEGRIPIDWQGRGFDMLVGTCPSLHGEGATVRVWDRSNTFIGLERLQIAPPDLARLREWIGRPSGLVLFSGPVGSGKTTTLYSCLREVATAENKTLTIEDPVELELPGAMQVSVNRKTGLSFAAALRAFLRQDPDIVMVGEVPDRQTAEMAIEVALGGHLVLSQMNSGDAASTVTRLLDLGVEPFMVAASLSGVMSQRLARRVCPQCREGYKPQPELLSRLGFDARSANAKGADAKRRRGAKFFRGRGCDACRHTGFRGRVPLYELLNVDEEMARLIVARAPLSRLREAARQSGMKTLQEDGLDKALDGVTTVEEVARVSFSAQSV